MSTYAEITEIVGIPRSTLNDWKNRDDYRGVLFKALREMTKEELAFFVGKANKQNVKQS